MNRAGFYTTPFVSLYGGRSAKLGWPTEHGPSFPRGRTSPKAPVGSSRVLLSKRLPRPSRTGRGTQAMPIRRPASYGNGSPPSELGSISCWTAGHDRRSHPLDPRRARGHGHRGADAAPAPAPLGSPDELHGGPVARLVTYPDLCLRRRPGHRCVASREVG